MQLSKGLHKPKTYVMGACYNLLVEFFLVSIHSILFFGIILIIIPRLSTLTFLLTRTKSRIMIVIFLYKYSVICIDTVLRCINMFLHF